MEDVDVSSLSTLAEVLAALSRVEAHEAHLDQELSTVISSRDTLVAQLDSLVALQSTLESVQLEARQMQQHIGIVAETAERVGGKVRVLDVQQSRVKETIEFVQTVQELKSCIASLEQSISASDWEAATRFMQRASALDPHIVASEFAEAVVPSLISPLAPPQTLADLRQRLLETFLNSFRIASSGGDVVNTNRFFKLFPMIGEEEIGLNVYAEWVSGIVRNKTNVGTKSQSVTHFSSLMTTLFESIALIISQHQPVVELNYGRGKMHAVAQTLLSESDRLGLQILANWTEERRIGRKLRETKEFRFSGLGAIMTGGAKGRSGPSPIEEEGKIEAREVDAVLAELALMSGRWELLRRFLYDRLRDTDEDEPTPPPPSNPLDDPPPTPIASLAAPESPVEIADLEMVEQSELGVKLSHELKEIFEPMEIWYLRSSIEKAHQMDELDLLSTPTLSSSLDDTFYILKKTVYRLVSTSSIGTVVDLSKEIRKVVERDVIEIWKTRMDGALRELTAIGGTARAREEEKERREKEARSTFIVYLNNLDTAAEYIVRLIDEVLQGETFNQGFFLPAEVDRARISILGIRSSESHFRNTLKTSLDHLFNQLVRPRLRPLLTEVYKEISYLLTEDGYADAEYRDDVRKRFIRSWEALMSPYRESLTASNYNIFFATTVNVLVRPWEGLVRSLKFTELGALRLDRDLRSISSYLSQSSSVSSSIRTSFARLSQIALLLMLEEGEKGAEEIEGILLGFAGGRLSKSEVSSVLALRV